MFTHFVAGGTFWDSPQYCPNHANIFNVQLAYYKISSEGCMTYFGKQLSDKINFLLIYETLFATRADNINYTKDK